MSKQARKRGQQTFLTFAARGVFLRLDHIAFDFGVRAHQRLHLGEHAETRKVVQKLLLALAHELLDDRQHDEMAVLIVLEK